MIEENRRKHNRLLSKNKVGALNADEESGPCQIQIVPKSRLPLLIEQREPDGMR